MAFTVKDGNGVALVLQSVTNGSGEHAPVQQSTTAPDVTLTGAPASAVNIDLLTGTLNGWFDVSSYRNASIQIIGSAGISAGAITFEQTNDITFAAAGVPLRAYEASIVNNNPFLIAVPIAASSTRIFSCALTSRFVRVRISTAFTGGTVQAVAVLSQGGRDDVTLNVQQAVAGNLNVTATNADNIFYNDSSTALAANATFTGTARNSGTSSTNLRYAKFNAFAFSDQACTIRIEASTDSATWRRATADVAIAAGTSQYLTVPVVAAFHRLVVVNGATAQTAFQASSSYTAS